LDDIRELLYDALEASEKEGAVGLQRFFAAHPNEAPELRARVRDLRDAGLLEETQHLRDGLPEFIGEFRVLECLGQGGMGVVYLAEQPSLGRRIALKLVRPEHLLFPGARERFQREVAVVARLSHPGVVPIYSVGEAEGVPYFVMEAVPGATLAEVLHELAGQVPEGQGPDALTGRDLLAALRTCRARRGGPSGSTSSTELFHGSWAQVATKIVLRVAEALAHAHERGVLHRDVKPANIMITEDGRVLLLDFGLASLQGTSRLTRTGSLLGSVRYMAPEQLRGDASDARSDVWSTGVVFYELLTLRLPFDGRSDLELRHAIERAAPRSARHFNAGLTWDVETVCATALERDPAQRYQDTAQLAEDLHAILELRPIRARRPSRWQELRRSLRRHPAAALAALFGVSLLIGGPLVYGLVERNARVRIEAANLSTAEANTKLGEAVLRAEAERDRADREREQAHARYDDALAAVDLMLRRSADGRLAAVPGTAALRRQFHEDALQFHTRLVQETGDDPRALLERGRSLLRAARSRFELGQIDEAHAALNDGLALLESLSSEPERTALLRQELARGYEQRGRALARKGRHEESCADLARAVAEQARLVALEPEVARHAEGLLTTRISEAFGLLEAGRPEEASAALATLRKELATPAARALPQHWSMHDEVEEALAMIALRAGEYRTAEDLLAASLAALEAVQVAPSDERSRLVRLVGVISKRAELAHQRREWRRARPLIDAALESLETFAAQEQDVPQWRSRLAAMLSTSADNHTELGDAEGSLEDHARAIQIANELVERYPTDIIYVQRLGLVLAVHAGALIGLGRVIEALGELDRAIAELERYVAARPRDVQGVANLAAALGNSVQLRLRIDDAAGARAAAERALELERNIQGGLPSGFIELLSLTGRVAAMDGDLEVARTRHAEAVDEARRWHAGDPNDGARAFVLAEVGLYAAAFCLAEGRNPEAEELLAEVETRGHETLEQGFPDASHTLALARVLSALAAETRGDAAAAAKFMSAAEEVGLSAENHRLWLAVLPATLEFYRRVHGLAPH